TRPFTGRARRSRWTSRSRARSVRAPATSRESRAPRAAAAGRRRLPRGQRVRGSGEGTGAPGARGDLYLSVTVAAHPFFERKGDDVLLTLPITAPEAALGTSIEVPTLRGKVSMKVPPATSSGRTFRLPGYGMPRLKGGGGGGQVGAVRVL